MPKAALAPAGSLLPLLLLLLSISGPAAAAPSKQALNEAFRDAPDGFHAMQSVEPFLEWILPDVDWPKASVTKTADEAFFDFLSNKDSTLLFSGRPMLPKDFANAGCVCSTEDCTHEVRSGAAQIPCGEVRSFDFELTSDRVMLIANSANAKLNYVHSDLFEYFTSDKPISCSAFGGDADTPVSFYVPSEATATGFYLQRYLTQTTIQAPSHKSLAPGPFVSIEASFDDILIKVSKDKCAIGIVPLAIADGCESSGKVHLPPKVCSKFQVVSIDDAPCTTCTPERTGHSGLDSPIFVYLNLNTVANSTEADDLLKGIFARAVDYHMQLFDMDETHRDPMNLLNRKKGCRAIERLPYGDFPPIDLSTICVGQFLCCHERNACDPDWWNQRWYFNLTEMFWDSPCHKCREQAKIDNLVPGLCIMRTYDCVSDAIEHCIPEMGDNQPMTVCFFCGPPVDGPAQPMCLATYVYFGLSFPCVDDQTYAFYPITEAPVDPCAFGDCVTPAFTLSDANNSYSCNQHLDTVPNP